MDDLPDYPCGYTFRYEKSHPNASINRATKGSAAFDIANVDAVTLTAGEIRKVNTGIRVVQMPYTSYGRMAVRSSWAIQGVDVLGGIIDADYHGDIFAIFINHSKNELILPLGARVAQLILERRCVADAIEHSKFKELEEARDALRTTLPGVDECGFGSEQIKKRKSGNSGGFGSTNSTNE